jgi:hypothetical protein
METGEPLLLDEEWFNRFKSLLVERGDVHAAFGVMVAMSTETPAAEPSEPVSLIDQAKAILRAIPPHSELRLKGRHGNNEALLELLDKHGIALSLSTLKRIKKTAWSK